MKVGKQLYSEPIMTINLFYFEVRDPDSKTVMGKTNLTTTSKTKMRNVLIHDVPLMSVDTKIT
jgi:hypothetical protein